MVVGQDGARLFCVCRVEQAHLPLGGTGVKVVFVCLISLWEKSVYEVQEGSMGSGRLSWVQQGHLSFLALSRSSEFLLQFPS